MARKTMGKKIKLPERTKYFFNQFVNGANKQILHPLDWKRFYIFIQASHEGNTKLLQGKLECLLIDNGFPEDNASSLSNIYYHGRHLLESRVKFNYVYSKRSPDKKYPDPADGGRLPLTLELHRSTYYECGN